MTQPARPGGKKKGASGCGVVLLMFAAVGAMGAIMFVVSLVRAFSTDHGRELTHSFTEVAALVEQAQTAPGAEDVAKEGGCLQALVMDADKLAALADTGPAVDGGKTKRGQEKTLVTCQVGFAKAPPECQALALVYVRAGRPTAPFRVAVAKQGDPNRTCDRVFDAKGQPVIVSPEPAVAIIQPTQTVSANDDAGSGGADGGSGDGGAR